MVFKVEVTLGNDAMRTGREAIRAIADAEGLNCGDSVALAVGDEGTIRDDNGNTVGRWEVCA